MNARILVVDDDPWILRMVTATLQKRGYTVDTAREGREALERAHTCPPDVVITDVMMPVMDGWTFAQQMRTVPHLLNIPVVFLTALGKDEPRLRALGLTPDDYLAKPFRFEELERRVAGALARRRTPQGDGHRPPSSSPPMQRPAGYDAAPPGMNRPDGAPYGYGNGYPGYPPYGQPGYPPPGNGQGGYAPNAQPPYPPPPSPAAQPGFPGPGYPQGQQPHYPNAGGYPYGNPGYPGYPPPPYPAGPYGQPPYEPSAPPVTPQPSAMPAPDARSSANAGRRRSTALNGRLEQLQLSSLLVMMEMERKDGVLTLRDVDVGDGGRIFLRGGQVVCAQIDAKPDQPGRECVYEMLRWNAGTFSFSATEVDMEDSVKSSTTHLLMEGARLIDEAARDEF